MFMFGFRQYMQHAFPRDDLRPISCRGHDTQGGIANTLVDSLDTLLVGRQAPRGSMLRPHSAVPCSYLYRRDRASRNCVIADDHALLCDISLPLLAMCPVSVSRLAAPGHGSVSLSPYTRSAQLLVTTKLNPT